MIAPTFARIDAEKQIGRLLAYRAFVAHAARGEVLDIDARKELTAVMGGLQLPGHCWQRDVIAVRFWPRAAEHRRRELLANYPHLFDECDEWVAERQARARRLRSIASGARS
jgi:hypothetical protein